MSDEIDASVESALEAVLSGMPEQPGAGAPASAQPAESPAPAQTKPEVSDEELAASAKSAIVDRALKRIAERERRVAEREKAVEKAPERRWNKATIAADLYGFLEAQGVQDPGRVIRAGMARVLGDKAPDEYRRLGDQLKDEGSRDETTEGLREEISALKARLEQQDQSRTAARYVADYQAQLDTHLGGDLTQYPNLANSLKNDRDWTVGSMWEIIRADSRAKAQAMKPGQPLPEPITPAQVLETMERELGSIARRLGVTEPKPAQTKSKDEQAPTAQVARKTLTAVQPTKPPQGTDPDDIDGNFKEALSWFNSL